MDTLKREKLGEKGKWIFLVSVISFKAVCSPFKFKKLNDYVCKQAHFFHDLFAVHI